MMTERQLFTYLYQFESPNHRMGGYDQDRRDYFTTVLFPEMWKACKKYRIEMPEWLKHHAPQRRGPLAFIRRTIGNALNR